MSRQFVSPSDIVVMRIPVGAVQATNGFDLLPTFDIESDGILLQSIARQAQG